MKDILNLKALRIEVFRESSFNMTRQGDEDFEGLLRKCLDTRKGGSENVYTLNPKGRGAPKKLNR